MGQTTSQSPAISSCPVNHGSASIKPPAECPVSHNPFNNIPKDLPQTPISSKQSEVLPTDRVASSIPRNSSTRETWEYPSPQQFYNALVRKGWETPEEHVEAMVDIHNFLNEQAWEEVLKWERRNDTSASNLELARFCGRPGELSPKARFYLLAGWFFPSHFNTEPPFDRHDWIVRRNTGEEVRYVIDYYSAPPEPDGSPVFSLDVRPALDSLGSIKERITVATEEAWLNLRAKGGQGDPVSRNQA